MLGVSKYISKRAVILTNQNLNTKMSHNGVNNVWILKNSTSLLSSLEKLDVRYAKSVQTFDFSTLYTSIPHDLFESRISTIIQNSFKKKDGSIRHTYIKWMAGEDILVTQSIQVGT